MPARSLNLFQVEKLLSEFVYFIAVSLKSLSCWTYLSYIDDKIICEFDFLWHRLLKTPGALFIFHGWFDSLSALLLLLVVMLYFLYVFLIGRVCEWVFLAWLITYYLRSNVALSLNSYYLATTSRFVADLIQLNLLYIMPFDVFLSFLFYVCRYIRNNCVVSFEQFAIFLFGLLDIFLFTIFGGILLLIVHSFYFTCVAR